MSPCLLNEQHMPRSVGYIEKMLEQLTLTPFHMHLLIMAANMSKNIDLLARRMKVMLVQSYRTPHPLLWW